MASWVVIANLALSHLGANRIISLDDGSAEARAIAAVYEAVRDTVLREHPWNCARRRAVLPADATAAIGAVWSPGRAFAYTLPADPWCLRALGIEGSGSLWTVEGRTLLTDTYPPLALLYIARVVDPEQFDAALTTALAARIAHAIAPEITQSSEKEDRMWQLSDRLLRSARSLDGQEGSRIDRVSTFITARW